MVKTPGEAGGTSLEEEVPVIGEDSTWIGWQEAVPRGRCSREAVPRGRCSREAFPWGRCSKDLFLARIFSRMRCSKKEVF